MGDINEISIVDLDVYGRSSQSGGALTHQNDFAISNAIIFYLTSQRGDYLYRNDLGGVLNELLFKLLTEDKAEKYASRITGEIESQFGGVISEVAVTVTPNFTDRYYEIEIFYISNRTQLSNQAVFYTRPKVSSEEINYIDVLFTDDNLLAFVTLQLDMGLKKPLIFNQTDNKWYWNLFRLINFSKESSNFEEIYNLINQK